MERKTISLSASKYPRLTAKEMKNNNVALVISAHRVKGKPVYEHFAFQWKKADKIPKEFKHRFSTTYGLWEIPYVYLGGSNTSYNINDWFTTILNRNRMKLDENGTRFLRYTNVKFEPLNDHLKTLWDDSNVTHIIVALFNRDTLKNGNQFRFIKTSGHRKPTNDVPFHTEAEPISPIMKSKRMSSKKSPAKRMTKNHREFSKNFRKFF